MPSIWYSSSRHCYIFLTAFVLCSSKCSSTWPKYDYQNIGWSRQQIGVYTKKNRCKTLALQRLSISWRLFRSGLWNPFETFLRRGRDSNPRNAFGVYTLSRRASSTTRAPLQIILFRFARAKVQRFSTHSHPMSNLQLPSTQGNRIKIQALSL